MKFAEASLLIPLTILIIVSLIYLMMGFYNDLIAQIEIHTGELDEIFKSVL